MSTWNYVASLNNQQSMQFNFGGWGFWRGGSRNQTDELMADSLQGRVSSRDSARVSHHPLVVLPVDGD